MIDLIGKTPEEKAILKAEAVAAVTVGVFNCDGFDIEVVGEITQVPNGGIQLFAKASENGNPVGFGKDGTVEIERFKIYNPPILIDDINGDIFRY